MSSTIIDAEMPPGYLLKPEKTARHFWKHVDKSGDCWLWTGSRWQQGYGKIVTTVVLPRQKKQQIKAHRLSYYLVHGSIPRGLCVCHKCDNPPCVNPDHLFLGTVADNTRDMISKGRKVKCPCGPNSSRTKLNLAIVKSIRLSYGLGESQRSLAKSFGLARSTIETALWSPLWICVNRNKETSDVYS